MRCPNCGVDDVNQTVDEFGVETQCGDCGLHIITLHDPLLDDDEWDDCVRNAGRCFASLVSLLWSQSQSDQSDAQSDALDCDCDGEYVCQPCKDALLEALADDLEADLLSLPDDEWDNWFFDRQTEVDSDFWEAVDDCEGLDS